MSEPEDRTSAQTPDHVRRLTPTSMPPGAPQLIGRFEIQSLLGEGTFGRVYLALDPTLKRSVAIKTPHSVGLTAEFRTLFLREAHATSGIHHPNVCPVYDVGVEGDIPYIVMRYVEGGTLDGLLRRGPMSLANVLRIARKLALGLEAAHVRGVIHRDLKPANVLFDEAAREMLIADFGLARIASHSQASVTVSRREHGTPYYMPPEQWGSQAFGAITPLADVYSLGVILYQMLTGQMPFTGSPFELMTKHCTEKPQPLSTVRGGLDTRLDTLCLKALEKKPADRYSSAKEFATALADYLQRGPLELSLPETREQTCRVSVPGTVSSRPAGDSSADWVEVAVTPGEVTFHPQNEYMLCASDRVTDGKLACPAELRRFRAIGLGDCYKLTDEAIEHLCSLTNLLWLDLSGCDICDEALVYLSSLANLEALDLSWCEEVTDEGLALIDCLHSLQTLGLSNCDITDAGLQHLGSLSNLVSLDLSGCGITNTGLQRLGSLLNLRTLDLDGCHRLTDAGLEYVARLTGLRSLNLCGCEVTATAVIKLSRLLPTCAVVADSLLWGMLQDLSATRGIESVLSLDWSGYHEEVTDDWLACLESFTSLESLDLTGCPEVTSRGLEQLQHVPRLQSLSLGGCEFDDDDLEHLDKISTLRHLRLVECECVTEDGFAHLSRLVNLRSLDFSGSESITDGGLECLGSFTKLERLIVHDCSNISDQGLMQLTQLASLQVLDLHSIGRITDAGLGHIKCLSNLETLHLDAGGQDEDEDLGITDLGLEYLKSLTRLRSLVLRGWLNISGATLVQLKDLADIRSIDLRSCSNITDDALPAFPQFPRLQHLDLSYCGITDAGLARLSCQLPNCTITGGSGMWQLLKTFAAPKMFDTVKSLDLSGRGEVADKSIIIMGVFPNLEILNLYGCFNFSENGIVHIQCLSKLKKLNIGNISINSERLLFLRSLPGYERLNLGDCAGVTDIGLSHLEKMTSLQSLSLDNSRLMTDGGLQCLASLTDLQSLTSNSRRVEFCLKSSNS